MKCGGGLQGGEISVEGTLLSPAHPDSVLRLLEDYDGVAGVFSAIHESRKELLLGQLQLIQVRCETLAPLYASLLMKSSKG